jgi:hypothetical protein
MSRRGGFFGSLATGLAGGVAQSTKDIGRRLIESQRYADAQQRYQQREATRQAERREMMDIQKAMRDAQGRESKMNRALSMVPVSQRLTAFGELGEGIVDAPVEQLQKYVDADEAQKLAAEQRQQRYRLQLMNARNRLSGGRGSAGVDRQLAVGDRNALELPIKELFKTSKYINKQLGGLQKQVSDGTLEPKQADDMREKLTIQLNKLRDRQSAAPGALSALGEAITRRRSGQQLNPANVINALERYIYASTGQAATEESIRFLGSQFGLLSPNAQLTPGVSGLGVLNLRSNQQ